MKSYYKEEQEATDGLLNATKASEERAYLSSPALYTKYSGVKSPQYLYFSIGGRG